MRIGAGFRPALTCGRAPFKLLPAQGVLKTWKYWIPRQGKTSELKDTHLGKVFKTLPPWSVTGRAWPDNTAMKQQDLGLNLSKRRTRKAVFLDEMNLVVPWSELLALIAPHAPRQLKDTHLVGEGERRGIDSACQQETKGHP